MRFEGHAGLTLLVMSGAFLMLNYPMAKSLLLILTTAIFSSLPDLDLKTRGFIEHRSPLTHSMLAGCWFGLAFGLLFEFLQVGFMFGFICAFLGTTLHLVGDSMTFTRIQPLWPFSERRVALGLFRSSNLVINWGFGVVGATTFVVYILSSSHLLYL